MCKPDDGLDECQCSGCGFDNLMVGVYDEDADDIVIVVGGEPPAGCVVGAVGANVTIEYGTPLRWTTC